MGELALRVVLGGVVVCAFAAAGEAFKPKTLAGMFGAAPSVALVTLAIAFSTHPGSSVATEARSMLCGGLGIGSSSVAWVAMVRWRAVPMWAGVLACWMTWAAASFGLLFVIERLGVA